MIDLDIYRPVLLSVLFGLPRILLICLLLPPFSRQMLPGQTRNGVALSLLLAIQPLLLAGTPVAIPPWPDAVAILVKEMFLGLLIGYAAAIPFWVAESTGYFIDNQRGTTMASSIDPMTGEQTSPLGVLLAQTLGVFFFVGGGLPMFLTVLYESYRLWPVFSLMPRLDPAAIPTLLGMIDRVMALTVLLAAPVIIAMFMTEFAMGLISRFTPQMNVFSLAMPIKSGLATLLLALCIAPMFIYLGDELARLGDYLLVLDRWLR
jgi:type III secretion protein T